MAITGLGSDGGVGGARLLAASVSAHGPDGDHQIGIAYIVEAISRLPPRQGWALITRIP